MPLFGGGEVRNDEAEVSEGRNAGDLLPKPFDLD